MAVNGERQSGWPSLVVRAPGAMTASVQQQRRQHPLLTGSSAGLILSASKQQMIFPLAAQRYPLNDSLTNLVHDTRLIIHQSM